MGRPATARKKLDSLLAAEKWEAARTAIHAALEATPDDHWLLTQLGLTYYEQGKCREALGPLRESLKLVADCPLTLWNLAGTFGALGEHEKAVEIYRALIASEVTAEDDPCWESAEWADALRVDCVYRLAVSAQRLGRRDTAEVGFREYIKLHNAGRRGTYPVEEAFRRLIDIAGATPAWPNRSAFDAASAAVLKPRGKIVTVARRRPIDSLINPPPETTGR